MGSSVFAACYVHISELTACLVFFLCPMFTLTSSQPTCHTRLEQKQPHFRVFGGSTKNFLPGLLVVSLSLAWFLIKLAFGNLCEASGGCSFRSKIDQKCKKKMKKFTLAGFEPSFYRLRQAKNLAETPPNPLIPALPALLSQMKFSLGGIRTLDLWIEARQKVGGKPPNHPTSTSIF